VNVRAAVLLISLPLAWACASAGGSQTGQASAQHDPYVLTAAELATSNASNLFDAIRQLRPRWLERLGPTTFSGQGEYSVMVYTDRIRLGAPDMLRQVPISLPQSVRYYSASEAQAEFGVGNLQGAIQIVTRRQK
jgi:hypothetical protein